MQASGSPLEQLNMFVQRRHQRQQLQWEIHHHVGPENESLWRAAIKWGDVWFVGFGAQKCDAKQNAAGHVLAVLRRSGQLD
ncbi:hypothetical protein BOTBODRAFT_32453 [Botryobasidium botryosum FD-172 SS1]|uniref:DRBM domain-containing protein n=1 Tax=Botryobasidium botryosum (strain FD-172 SS1) TaxID=930990 RepID=A0A067MSX8_BOTB1|nr:hypothetical protein BOTBODRAFT_32453 [Botryobasidium botryosum FD-172 SS1]